MDHKAESTTACVSDRAGERTLVVAAKNGDEQAFETLFKRYQRRTFAVVLRYTRVVEDAEDIVQQSFYKAFVHLCRFQGESSFSTWLTRIAINEALMFLRSLGAVRTMSIEESSEREGPSNALEIPDSSLDPETSCARQEEVQILSQALGNLRPQMRKAIQLRDLEEVSTEEAARRMGLSVGALKAQLFHARRKLRKKLSRHLRARPLSPGCNRTGAGFTTATPKAA
jgi:RNA polymerase sigma-70 factor, ECF subfamily